MKFYFLLSFFILFSCATSLPYQSFKLGECVMLTSDENLVDSRVVYVITEIRPYSYGANKKIMNFKSNKASLSTDEISKDDTIFFQKVSCEDKFIQK